MGIICYSNKIVSHFIDRVLSKSIQSLFRTCRRTVKMTVVGFELGSSEWSPGTVKSLERVDNMVWNHVPTKWYPS